MGKGKGKGRSTFGRKEYEAELFRLQIEVCKLQRWVQEKGKKLVVLFEGRDAAGKGGVIKRIAQRVSSRVFQVVALPKPSDREKTQFYFQRYISRLPGAGEVVLFDRSWYNRAGVERVMGFCDDEQYERFMRTCSGFEQAIIESGIILVKYWFEVSQEVQRERFLARIQDPTKQWKLSPMDIEAIKRWYDYSRARDAMFKATHTEHAPWYVVKADVKRHARLNCISHLLSVVPYQDVPVQTVKLPRPPNARGYKEPKPFFEQVPEKY